MSEGEGEPELTEFRFLFVSKQALALEGTEIDEDDEQMFYLRRLEGGLFTLQMIDYILAWLIMEDDGVRFLSLFLPRSLSLQLQLTPTSVSFAVGAEQARDQAKLLLERKDQTFQEIIDVLQGSFFPPTFLSARRVEWTHRAFSPHSRRVSLSCSHSISQPDPPPLLLPPSFARLKKSTEQHDNVGDASSEEGENSAAESQRVILEGLMNYLRGSV